MKTVAVKHSDLSAKVDDVDFGLVSAYSWALHAKGYAYCRFWNGDGYSTIYMHRLIAGADKCQQVDHEDHDKLNNQRYNLRVATCGQNSHNSLKPKHGTTSVFKGVSRHTRDDRWVAHIRGDGKSKYLGLFVNERDAALAYNGAARHYFGEFAQLNVI